MTKIGLYLPPVESLICQTSLSCLFSTKTSSNFQSNSLSVQYTFVCSVLPDSVTQVLPNSPLKTPDTINLKTSSSGEETLVCRLVFILEGINIFFRTHKGPPFNTFKFRKRRKEWADLEKTRSSSRGSDSPGPILPRGSRTSEAVYLPVLRNRPGKSIFRSVYRIRSFERRLLYWYQQKIKPLGHHVFTRPLVRT